MMRAIEKTEARAHPVKTYTAPFWAGTKADSPVSLLKRGGFRATSFAFLCSAILLVLVPAPARAWWNKDWHYRIRVGLDTTENGADVRENLEEVPILIRLHSGNFNFSNVKEDGSDLRFVSSDDKTVFKHHIERFDFLDEIGLIWVKIPRLPGGSNQDFIWMYYGNPEAVGGQDEHGTYDVHQALVYHLNEQEGVPQDSSIYKNHAFDFRGMQGIPSVVGNGIGLRGGDDKIVLQPSDSLRFAEGFTFSAWVRIAQPQTDAYLYFRRDQDSLFVVGIDGTHVYFQYSTKDQGSVVSEKSVELTLGLWQFLAVTVEPSGRVAILLDGLQMYYADGPFRVQGWKSGLVLGASEEGDHVLIGELDEIQLSSTARKTHWLRACWASQAAEGLLCHLGQEEICTTASHLLLTFAYLKTVIRYITLDGWVIIGTITILSTLCWIIFISKAVVLRFVDRENRNLVAVLNEGRDPWSLSVPAGEFQYSTAYPVYCAARNLVHPWLGDRPPEGEKRILPRRILNAVRAALDRGVVEESRRLNSGLLLLTMTIAGAPMLGLLGTVWGVMNTFASMADSGESNIMAIAPGVSSALATTVAGLVAAIPALFCYNYLAHRVKGITVDTSGFADELTLRVEEYIGEKG